MQKRRIWNYEKRNKKTIVEFKDVVRTYGEGEALQYAVNHVNFTIEEGEFVVILGQSGAGKLTVLNMLGGMDQPTEGEVIIDGEIVSSMNDKQLSDFRADKIGFIFQFYNLLPSLTAYENVALTKSIVKDAEDPGKMLEAVGLGDHKNKFPAQLSGGEQQRTQIGTMNALGFKRRKIMLHYISFSLVVSVVGVILGLLAGTLWGSPAVIGMFANWYIVPGLHSVFHPMYLIIAAGIVAVCVLASYISCRKLLRIKPAEALRPAAPKKGKKCIFERLPFWKKLSFTSQYNLRDISRAKLRSFMCVIGTAVGMLLMIYAVGCNELLGSMIEINFNRVTVGEYQIKFSEDAKTEDVDDMTEELDGEVVMVNQVEVAKKKNAPADEKKKETITVLEGKNLYNILDLNNQIKELTPGTIGISRKLAADLDVKVGDTVYWHLYTKNTWYEAKVGTIYRSLESQGIAYLREDYEKTGAEYTPSLLMTDDKAAKDKTDLDYVTGVNSKSEMQAAYESSMEIMNMMVGMMAVFSILMIVVVLYNSGVLSFHERVKEFATLKVLGLRSSKIRRILSMQNLWLSIIGIIIGAPLGNVSLNAMINTNGENFDYNLMLAPVDYVIAGIFVMIISMLVSFMFSKRIRKLDMVETLKGVE